MSRDSQLYCQLFSPDIINKHMHLFDITKPKTFSYLNFVFQMLLPILRIIGHTFQFDSSRFYLSVSIRHSTQSGLKLRLPAIPGMT